MEKQVSYILVLLILFWSCGDGKKETATTKPAPEPSGLPGPALAIRHCGECHTYTGPQLLPRSIWENDVLPSMGYRMGIYEGEHQPDSLFEKGIGGTIVRKAAIFPEEPTMAREDWDKIVEYYLANAPDTIKPPVREKEIRMGLRHFTYREASYRHNPPLTIMVKILPDGRGIVFGDGKNDMSNLSFLTPDLAKDYNIRIRTTPVHYYEKSDTIYLTTIGFNMYPHDAPNGTVQKVYRKEPGGQYATSTTIIKNLQRPVYMDYADLNGDGREDIVACEYGNLTGKLVWYENTGRDTYRMRPLRAEPGAIKADVRDVDGDGLPDIIALMAQGDEGMFWYKNRGNGTFVENKLLPFLPLYGSQYFEFADFNDDGHDDLLYVCGDNADLTPILKAFHGLYIYLNDGNFNFDMAWFYHLNGAYKAVARDFDLDGDLDIAAISFFPDYRSYPEESFVYLENRGNLHFSDFSFPGATQGRWIVMDTEDMDADGDVDIALGSFVSFAADGDTTGLGEKWIMEGPSIAVLENTIRP